MQIGHRRKLEVLKPQESGKGGQGGGKLDARPGLRSWSGMRSGSSSFSLVKLRSVKVLVPGVVEVILL